ncbi:MAG: glycosyltransferase [Candidatus Altiarchaeota archaeon]
MASSVAHVIWEYLTLSETFLYDQISTMRSFRPIVLTDKVDNLEVFPFNPIYKLPRNFGPRLVEDRIWWRLTGSNPTFENAVRKENVELLHAHFGPTGVYVIPLKTRKKIPLITSFYGYDASKVLLESPKVYEKLFSEGERFIAISEYIQGRIIEAGCPNEKITLQRLGIDTQRFPFSPRVPKEGEPIKLLHIGRLVEKKGLMILIQALPDVLKEHPNVILEVIGDGPLKGEIENLIKELGVEKYVKLLGSKTRDEVLEAVLQSHVMVLPSLTAKDGDTEGLGVVLLEAQATGMPVVSTLHNGLPETVVDRKTGLLAKEGDVEDLKVKLLKVLDNQDHWPVFGRAGRAHVEENFNLKIQAEKLEEIYKDVLEK